MAIGLALAGCAGVLAACTSTGSGSGTFSTAAGQSEQPVTFTWTSQDGGITGTMTAQLPNAIYAGRFFQITQETRAETLGPLWSRWPYAWRDWPYGGPPAESFITHYSGRVVATLEAGSQYMRCRFQMSQPSRGMSGGGEGECQLSGGRTVRANFAPQ